MPDSVLDIIHRLSRTRSEDEIMAVVGKAVRQLLQADGATFALRDGDHCYYAGEDAVSPLWKGRRLPLSGCIAGWCMANCEAVAIADIHQDPRMFTAVYRPAFVRSLAVAPVGLDEPIAALGAYWSELRHPRPEELERLQAIADAAALAMANLQVHRASASAPPTTAPPPSDLTESTAGRHVSLRPAVERLLHEGLQPQSLQAYALAVALVLVATLLRQGVHAIGVEGITMFSFYYPAVLIALVAGGKRAGVLAAAAGGFAALFLFLPPRYAFWLATASDAINLGLYAVACGAIILTVDWYHRAVLRLKHEDARHLTLARETQHRSRNALALVEIIVRQSLRDDPVSSRVINQRIRAALADFDMLLRTRPIRTAELLAEELEPFDLTRFSLDGDSEALLAPEVSSILTLAAHELATNALKYGALSVTAGQVMVTWRVSGNRALIRWREAGGPRVQRPQRRGYGFVMLHRLVEAAGGAIRVEFPPSGATAEISLPLVKCSAEARQRFPPGFLASGAEVSRA